LSIIWLNVLNVHVILCYNEDVSDPQGGITKIKKSMALYVGEGEEPIALNAKILIQGRTLQKKAEF